MLFALIVLPLIFAFLLSISFFARNPLIIRTFSRLGFFVQFVISSVFLCVNEEIGFDIFGIDFLFNKMTFSFLFLASLIFFLFSIISKTFIQKLHRVFYASAFLILGLINIAISVDNIFVFLTMLFWVLLLSYFLAVSFSDKNVKKALDTQLLCDLLCLFAAISLILKEFARYFVVNEINFAFSNLINYLYKIDDVSIVLAFFGFLMILGRLFNFIPFCAKNMSNAGKINSFVFALNSIINLILACVLFVKCYVNFDYLFYQYQDEIVIFLIINLLIYTFLTLKQRRLFKFLTSIFIINSIVAIFSTFSFAPESIANFIYFALVLSLSYSLCAFVFMILKNKFKTDDIDEFKKIEDKTRLTQTFVSLALLNIAPIPLTPLFGAVSIGFLMIFSTEYEGEILNIVPYCLIIALFLTSLAVFGILHKIMAEPVQKAKKIIAFSNHQVVVCFTLVLVLFFFAIFMQNICKLFIESGQI